MIESFEAIEEVGSTTIESELERDLILKLFVILCSHKALVSIMFFD
jgi:hypothetical protein